MNGRTELRLALAVVAAGLAGRALFSFIVIPAWESGSNLAATPDEYAELARSMLERGTFGFLQGAPESTTTRGPGFPAWLLPCVALFGEDPRWLGLWAGIPGALAAGCVAVAASRRAGAIAGIVAGAIAACHPLPLAVSGRVEGDELYGALGWAAIAVWSAADRGPTLRGRWGPPLLCGVLLGWQILTRANGLLTLLAIAALALAGPRARIRGVAVVALVALVIP